MGTFTKRLAILAVGLMTAGAAVAGTATAASAADGGCDSSRYQFCVYTNAGYSGDFYKVPWGQDARWIDLPSNLDRNVSSVVNNTGQTWVLAQDSGQIILNVSPFHHLSNLRDWGADNQAQVIGFRP